jgi:hypothetical protein
MTGIRAHRRAKEIPHSQSTRISIACETLIESLSRFINRSLIVCIERQSFSIFLAVRGAFHLMQLLSFLRCSGFAFQSPADSTCRTKVLERHSATRDASWEKTDSFKAQGKCFDSFIVPARANAIVEPGVLELQSVSSCCFG